MQGWSGKPLEVVQRVDLGAEEIAVHVDLSRFLDEGGAIVRHAIPTRIRRRGVEIRLVLDGEQNGSSDVRVDPALVKAIVRGRKWFDELASTRARSLVEIAMAEGVTDCYIGHLIPLAFLAPDIVRAILSGTQPIDLTTETLTKRINLPLAWAEQRALLGFDWGWIKTGIDVIRNDSDRENSNWHPTWPSLSNSRATVIRGFEVGFGRAHHSRTREGWNGQHRPNRVLQARRYETVSR